MNMFCVECGKPIEPNYRFCAYCGRPRRAVAMTRTTLKSSLPQVNDHSLRNLTLSLGGISVFVLVVVVGVISFLIFGGDKVSAYKVNIISKGSPENGGTLLRSCENCKNVSIQEKDTILNLPLEKDYGKTQSLRRRLVDQAQNYNGKDGVLSFVHEEYPNRLLHLSFDISGSVQDLDKQDDRRNASKVYSDLIWERLQDVLASKENLLLQGDEVMVRLYGPTREDNPCRETLHIKYSGPSWKAKFAYSNRTKEVSILVEELISPQIQ